MTVSRPYKADPSPEFQMLMVAIDGWVKMRGEDGATTWAEGEAELGSYLRAVRYADYHNGPGRHDTNVANYPYQLVTAKNGWTAGYRCYFCGQNYQVSWADDLPRFD